MKENDFFLEDKIHNQDYKSTPPLTLAAQIQLISHPAILLLTFMLFQETPLLKSLNLFHMGHFQKINQVKAESKGSYTRICSAALSNNNKQNI